MGNFKEAFLLWAVLFSAGASAEFIECKGGRAPTLPPTEIEVSVDMDKGKSFVSYIYPDGSRILHGLSLSRRKYPNANSVRYLDLGSDRVFLEVPLTGGSLVKGAFSHLPQELDAVSLDCEIFGSIPSGPRCPSLADKDRALLRAMDTAETLDEIEFLLQCGANPNVTNGKGCTPLMLAVDPDCHPGNAGGAINDWVGLSDLLLRNGAFVDLRDRKGETALIKSVKNGVRNICDVYIAGEADFNIKDNSGHTALMHAAIEGDEWVIKDVLDGNPDRRLKNKSGKTAYDLAKYWHDQDRADLVKIPDQTVTISGKADGSCDPLVVNLNAGQAVEFVLMATDKMFKLDSPALSLDLMADRNGSAKQIATLANRGKFKFKCGFHGMHSGPDGEILVK